MGAGHAHRLYFHEHSVLHRLPAQTKLVALLTFVLVVVSTPRTAYWAFGAYALLLAGAVAVSKVPPLFVLKRVAVEAPVVMFAVLLPFIAHGPRIDVLGLSVSEPGLLGGWNVLAKATLGVIGSILLAATTDQRDLLAGLERLHVPRQLVQIAAFMIRYLDVITEQLGRMRIARESRGFQARGIGSWPVLGKTAGALFIRSYERGERVHLAMLSRGYTGQLPALSSTAAAAGQWATAATLPVLALVVAVGAWVAT